MDIAHDHGPGPRRPPATAWLAGLGLVAVWLVGAWFHQPVPARPDDRPVGDLAFHLAFVVAPLALVVSFVGGSLTRRWPRLAPIVATPTAVAIWSAAYATTRWAARRERSTRPGATNDEVSDDHWAFC